MNSPTAHQMRPASTKRRRVWQHLFAILITLATLLPEAQPAQAETTQDTILCSPTTGCAVYPPPDLLYLNQGGIYGATPTQAASLKKLENQAVTNIIKGHGLSTNDADAVRSWARNDALGELYALLGEAIDASAAERTADQQNAVDWITAVAQRQNVKAAEAAAREYVKWAGLDLGYFDLLLKTNASKSQLEAFLSGMPTNYNALPGDATGGWCVYRSPAPYGDEYKGYQDTVCYAPSTIIKVPPTPTYDELVKWGQAKSTYPLLSNPSYASTANSIALGLSIGLPMGAVLGGTLATLATVTTYANYVQAATAWVRVTGGTVATASQWLSSVAPFTIAAGASTALVIIAALATAIIVGINVTDAAKLPGKLAALIDQTRTTSPDPSTLLSSTVGGTNFFSTFVGAATPAPLNQTCDNAIFAGSSPPGWYPLVQVRTDEVTLTGIAPCLNPTDIPTPSAADPLFLVTPKDATTQTAASSITFKNTASGTTTTARLSGNWFVTQTNGATAQSLRIAYTDWDGKQQNAWQIGNPTDGYTFLTYSAPADSSTTVEASTCVANGYCGADAVLKYLGADGLKYSATVRLPQPTVGTPTYSNAVEASPVTFKANDFKAIDAVGAITYEWRFYTQSNSSISIFTYDTGSGATATYTWPTGGTYRVDLIATDSRGVQVSTSLQAVVAGVPPTLTLAPDCTLNPSVACNSWASDTGALVSLKGKVGYTGSGDSIFAIVNWGDGIENTTVAGPGALNPSGNPLTLTSSSSQGLTYDLLGKHTYANPGTYYPTVTVFNMTDGKTYGGAASQTFVMTIYGTQAISFAPIGNHSYGDVFSVSATGGASGQPVTFSITPGCALSNVSSGAGTGSATVTVLSPGTCILTANQAGTATYRPAPAAIQQIVNLLAVLTVTAPSPTITYGEAVPAISPTYSGFVLDNTASVLTTQAACAAAPNSGAAGSYATTCSGGAAPGYSTRYVPGTLTINKAPLAITANDKSMTYGGLVPSFDAEYSGLVNGETSSVVSGLTCGAKEKGVQPVSSSTPAGSYPITCSGGSAANYSLSYTAGTLTIEKASTSTTLNSSTSPSVYGQSVTFTAAIAVNAPGSGKPSGTMTFKDGTSIIAGCDARPVDAVTGTATCTTSALSVAPHSVTASYSGDGNFMGSSTAAALAQTVNKAAVAATLASSTSPSTSGQAVTFSATVAAAAPGAGVPTGSVTFKDGATTLGMRALSASNGATVASITASGLSVGKHTISASYSGDASFLAGAGATLTLYVNTNLSGYPLLPSGAYKLSNTNLTGGYFVSAALAGASLTGSNLTGAVFLGANLSGANLSNSNLKGADFAGANLTGANLTGANLKGATGLSTATLTNVVWNKTTCPDATISNNNGGTCVGHL
jgi:hypothetical protein